MSAAAAPSAPGVLLQAPSIGAAPRSAPSPTPVVVVSEQTVTSALPFERTTVDDAALPSGQSLVSTAGVDGEKVSIFRVTTIDGVESERVLVSESVGRAPVSEITARGTYVAPPPPAPVEAASGGDGCDPNYADACVPIDSDVYKLDGDGDGLACNGSR